MVKLFAVLVSEDNTDETSTDLFRKIYPSFERAKQECEADALEKWEHLVDPNSDEQQAFPGLDWRAQVGCIDLPHGGTSVYEVVEVELD